MAGVARPVLELKGMARIALAPAGRGTVRFTPAAEDLGFVGPDLAPRLEPGTFELSVGPTADRKTLLTTGVRVLDR